MTTRVSMPWWYCESHHPFLLLLLHAKDAQGDGIHMHVGVLASLRILTYLQTYRHLCKACGCEAEQAYVA